jgi:hypothetical protein
MMLLVWHQRSAKRISWYSWPHHRISSSARNPRLAASSETAAAVSQM